MVNKLNYLPFDLTKILMHDFFLAISYCLVKKTTHIICFLNLGIFLYFYIELFF